MPPRGRTRRRAVVLALTTGLFVMALTSLGGMGCKNKDQGPPVPASSDPKGLDLIPGAIVAATEDSGGVRLYKVKEIKFFPPPMSDEVVMIAFQEKANDFKHAGALWRRRKFTVALANVRVQRHTFVAKRKYRILAQEPVTEADKKLAETDAFK